MSRSTTSPSGSIGVWLNNIWHSKLIRTHTVLAAFVLLACTNSFGATFVAYNTGNWSSRSTWITTKTGTVTVASGSTAVVGSGTAFTTELQVGDKIYKNLGTSFTLVGTVASITSNTQLTLTAGATVALSAYALYSHGLPASTDDIQIGYINGTVVTTLTVDGNYACNLVHFVPNGGVDYKVDITASNSLTVTSYVYLVASTNNGNIHTMNVSGTLTAVGLYLQGGTTEAQNRASQLTIQSGGVVNITGDINIREFSKASKMIVSAVDTGSLNLGGNFLSTGSSNSSNTPFTTPPSLTTSTTLLAGTNSFAAASTINFNGTDRLQVLPISATTTYGNVYLNNAGNNVATLNASITATNLLGDVKVQSGIFTNQGASSSTTLIAASSSYTITGNAGKILEVDNGATLRQAGTSSFPTGFGTITLQPASTVDYIGTTQTISPQNFGNLTVSAGASAGRAVTLSSTGTIGVFTNFTPSSTNNVYTITSSTVAFNGNLAQTLPSNFATYNNLTVNNTSGSGITLGTSTTVNATLTFTTGIVTTGSNTLYLGSAGTVSRTSGHVVGNFKKFIATGATSKTFEVGDASNYTPVAVAFASVTTAGDLTASVVSGDHANIGTSTINATKSVNRNWTLTNSGIAFTTYGATFTFVAGDLDAGATTSAFIVGKYSAGWTYPTVGTKTSTTTQATGLTAFGGFQLGEAASMSPNVPLVKSVVPSSPQPPGADLVYTVVFTNDGGQAAQVFIVIDPIPANTDFKLGSPSTDLGTTGLTVAVEYSNDNASTWTYTPVSGGGGALAGYDRAVTHVRWRFTGNLSQTSPNNAGSVTLTTRIR